MRVIDFHQHLWIREVGQMQAEGARGFVAGMDRHGVERAVLHALPTSLYPHVGDNGDVLKAIREFPDRLIGSVYINPRDIARSLEALNRYHGEGFGCVKLLPYFEGVYVDDPTYTPVFEKVDELRLPVMIHMGPRGGLPRTGVKVPFDFKCIHPMYLTNLAARFPNTNFVIAHLAFELFWDAIALHRAYRNVYIEVSMNGPNSLARQVLLDLEKQGPKDRARVLRLDSRVMFGLDLNSTSYAEYIGYWKEFIEEAGKPQFLDAFFYATAARVLGLPV
ncbi:MAG: amidohydrolase family protein [Armatimonadetes bacterium]|nr:amidohydrolase family protein [Armatimonadota bacterium]